MWGSNDFAQRGLQRQTANQHLGDLTSRNCTIIWIAGQRLVALQRSYLALVAPDAVASANWTLVEGRPMARTKRSARRFQSCETLRSVVPITVMSNSRAQAAEQIVRTWRGQFASRARMTGSCRKRSALKAGHPQRTRQSHFWRACWLQASPQRPGDRQTLPDSGRIALGARKPKHLPYPTARAPHARCHSTRQFKREVAPRATSSPELDQHPARVPSMVIATVIEHQSLSSDRVIEFGYCIL